MTTAIFLIVIVHAWVNSYEIKQGWHIYHGWETVAYFGACSPFLFFHPFWKVLLTAILARVAFFDIALNLFRGKSWLYNGAGGSIIDRIENRLKIKPIILRIGGIAAFVVLVLSSCGKVPDQINATYKKAKITDDIIIADDSTILDGEGHSVSSVKVINASHVIIKNITVIGGGIEVYSDNGKVHKNIIIENVVSKNANYAGIWVHHFQDYPNVYPGHFEDITINKAITDSNGYSGIACTGDWPTINNRRFTITNCSATGNKGIRGMRPHSGHGIALFNVTDGVIDNCYAQGNGWQYGAGNIGIWTSDSKGVVISRSKSVYNISTANGDGGGFDIDGGSSNCTISDCYSEGNDGAGYLMYEYGSPNPMTRNTFIRDTSINDGNNKFYTAFFVGGVPVPDYVTITNNFAITDGRPALKIINNPPNSLINFNSWQ